MNITAKYKDSEQNTIEVNIEHFINVPNFLNNNIKYTIDYLGCNEIISRFDNAKTENYTPAKYSLELEKYEKAKYEKEKALMNNPTMVIDSLSKLIATGTKNYNINTCNDKVKEIWSLVIDYYKNYRGTFEWSEQRKHSAKTIKNKIDDYMNDLLTSSTYLVSDTKYVFKTNNSRFEDLVSTTIVLNSSNDGAKITLCNPVTFAKKFSIWACVVMGIEKRDKIKKEEKTF